MRPQLIRGRRDRTWRWGERELPSYYKAGRDKASPGILPFEFSEVFHKYTKVHKLNTSSPQSRTRVLPAPRTPPSVPFQSLFPLRVVRYTPLTSVGLLVTQTLGRSTPRARRRACFCSAPWLWVSPIFLPVVVDRSFSLLEDGPPVKVHDVFINSATDRHLGSFQFGAIANGVAVEVWCMSLVVLSPDFCWVDSSPLF